MLVNPLEAARLLAVLIASPDGSALGTFGTWLIERLTTAGSAGLLVGVLVAWTGAAVTAATAVLRRTDLEP